MALGETVAVQLGQAVARGVPLVGREGHVARIVAVVRAAAGGAGGVLLVTGDGGMGKSRLLEESTARLDPGTLVAWGRCSNRDDAPAYWPWVQVLRCLGGELTAAELTASSLAAGVVARAVPELGDLFGVAAVADEPSHGLLREAVIESCPPQERRTLEAAAGVLAERHGDDPAWSASIGHHLVAGLSLTDPVDAVARLRVAADHAASRLAHDEAARHLASAAGLLRVEARCDVQLLEVLLALGQALARATGAAAAGRDGAPILLVSTTTLPAATAEQLSRLSPTQVVALGGTAVVDEDVLAAVDTLVGTPPTRLAGGDRYATAAEVARTFDSASTVYVATGLTFPDALAGAPIAGAEPAPILLTDPLELPEAAVAQIDRLAPTRIVVLAVSRPSALTWPRPSMHAWPVDLGIAGRQSCTSPSPGTATAVPTTHSTHRRKGDTVRRILTIALTLGALTAMGAPAHAGHAHFVHIAATNTCQYVGHGQTSIDEEGHGGYHRIHDNVHTGTPGTDGRGNTFDKQGNVGNYDGCVERGQR